MASVSISLALGQESVVNPDSITAGTQAPSAGAVELRVDMAQITSLEQINLALEQFEAFVRDLAKGPTTFKVL